MPTSTEKIQEDTRVLRSYQKGHLRERRRERDNWRVYDGTEFGQWNERSVREAFQAGVPLSTLNLLKKHIDITVGSIIADPFETRFDTEIGDENTDAIMLNERYLEDKDLGGWMKEFWRFVRAGFIYKGYLQIFVDRRRDARGRIGLRYFSPDRIQEDPNRTGNTIHDNENLLIHTWMSAQKIQDKYGVNNQEIRDAIEYHRAYFYRKNERTEGEEMEKVFDISPEFFDRQQNLFLVIDRKWLEKTKVFQIIDLESGEIYAETLEEEQAVQLSKEARANGVSTRIVPRVSMKSMIRTTIPGLSNKLVVQEGPTELQLGGYDFFEFSSDSINGRPNTYVDQLKDAQVTFNKRYNTATHILMTTANNTLLIESDALEDEDDLDIIGKNRNRPGAYFKVAPGTNNQNKIRHLQKNEPPNNYMDMANNTRDLMRELGPAVPALQAIGDQNESGVLFQSKVAQAKIALQLPEKYLGDFWHDFGEVYIKAFRQVYTYPIAFKSSEDGQSFFLNVPGGLDVARMSRMKVTVSQSPNSETYRRQLLQSYLSIVQYMHDPYTRSELSRIVVEVLPGIPEDKKATLAEAALLSSESQKLALIAQNKQIEASLQQGQAAATPQQTPTPQNQVNPEQVLQQVSEQGAPQ